jgi:hypothetical protein
LDAVERGIDITKNPIQPQNSNCLFFKTATGNRPVSLLPDGRVRWDYRQSGTNSPASVVLDAMEWMRRLLQHVLPRGFTRVRTYG